MRILIFHGYLLRGTGSNIYTASLTAALVELGHEVHLLCQDRRAAELPFVDAVGRFSGGDLRVEEVREPVRATAYLPDIGTTLPVYVADRYEGFDAVTFAELDDVRLAHYLHANVAAVRTLARRVEPQVALANHLVMGPVILARGLPRNVPYAVKIHGSALEYTVRPEPERFLAFAREGLSPARGVLVGSRHIAERLVEVVGDGPLRRKVRLGPPGVDTHTFRPSEAAQARERLRALGRRVEGQSGGFGADPGAAAALSSLDPTNDLLVTYVGKLIVSKGVDLLLAAWPLVAHAVPQARLCVVGFGTYRGALERLAGALAAGDLETAQAIASHGRELEGGPPGELHYLSSFLSRLAGGELGHYAPAARGAFDRLHFTGRLEHGDLPDLLSASLAQVVPSTFPEAFGMVAVEAAACGALPVSAAHSGLAEVSATLAPALPARLRGLLSFERGPGAVEEIARKLVDWLTLDSPTREQARAALASRARGLYGWEAVARGAVAAASGRLDELPEPASEAPSPPGPTG